MHSVLGPLPERGLKFMPAGVLYAGLLAWWRVTAGICSSLSWGPLDVVKPLHIAFSVNGYFDYVTKIGCYGWLMCMTTTIWTGMYKRGLGSTPHSDAWWENLFTPLLTPLGELLFLWAVSPECWVQKVCVVLLYFRWGLSIKKLVTR